MSLVWLPFDPADLGDPPDAFDYEVVDPDALPLPVGGHQTVDHRSRVFDGEHAVGPSRDADRDEHPGGGLAGVESGRYQCGRPVVAQVDRYRAPCRGGLGAKTGQRLRLERDDLGLVDLVDHRLARPRQPVGPGVQTGCHDHGLPDSGLGRLKEEVVEEAGAHGDLLADGLAAQQRILGVPARAIEQLDEGF